MRKQIVLGVVFTVLAWISGCQGLKAKLFTTKNMSSRIKVSTLGFGLFGNFFKQGLAVQSRLPHT